MSSLARQSPRILTMVRRPSEASGSGKTVNVRAVNPGRRLRKPSLKRMLTLGSQVLDRLHKSPEFAGDAEMKAQIQEIWETLGVAKRGSRGDRRVALTRLQAKLREWTQQDAHVADDVAVQRYRRQLHLVLDH